MNNIVDLIKNKYYKGQNFRYNPHSTLYFFKYVMNDDDYIYCDSYYITIEDNTIKYHTVDKNLAGLFTLKRFSLLEVFEEVSFKDIIDYLPNDNPDKKAYLRINKINSLLRCVN